MYLHRFIEEDVKKSLSHFPVTAIIGPRQCGKSTLVKHIIKNSPQTIYLDLERPSDLRKLDDAEWFLTSQRGKLICIDEIQRKPELFPLLRSLVDEWGTSGCFLILGSASRDLLKQSSESLAGRIMYISLTPFLWKELDGKHSLEQYFVQGGFPRSLLANDADISFRWRESFITTFLERDLKQWSGFSPVAMRRLWQMLAHTNGQIVNYSTLANSLGISTPTVKNYIDLLAGTFMVNVIQPYISNLGKRLVKSPRIYIADSGITTALQGLRTFEDLSGHPAFGAVWEQIVLANLYGVFPEASFFYYRTSNGAETDFVMTYRNKIFAIECKASYSPILSKGNYNAFEDIKPDHVFVVSPAPEGWSMKSGIDVVSLDEVVKRINGYFEQKNE